MTLPWSNAKRSGDGIRRFGSSKLVKRIFMQTALQADVVNLHEVHMLAILAVKFESKDKPLCRPFLKNFVDWIFCKFTANLIVQNPHNVAVRTLWAEKEKVVSQSRGPFKPSIRDRL